MLYIMMCATKYKVQGIGKGKLAFSYMEIMMNMKTIGGTGYENVYNYF